MITSAAHDDREQSRRRGLLPWLPLALLLLAGGVGTIAVSARDLSSNGSAGSPRTSASPAPTAGSSTNQPGLGSGSVVTSPQPATAGGNGNGNGNGGGTGNPGHAISLTGVVTGQVAPGSPGSLVVTISNTNNQDILVTAVSGAVTGVTTGHQAGKPLCQSSWYAIGSFSGSQLITKNSSGTVALPVTFTDLSGTNQDNCKGATYTFSFTAQARQA